MLRATVGCKWLALEPTARSYASKHASRLPERFALKVRYCLSLLFFISCANFLLSLALGAHTIYRNTASDEGTRETNPMNPSDGRSNVRDSTELWPIYVRFFPCFYLLPVCVSATSLKRIQKKAASPRWQAWSAPTIVHTQWCIIDDYAAWQPLRETLV